MEDSQSSRCTQTAWQASGRSLRTTAQGGFLEEGVGAGLDVKGDPRGRAEQLCWRRAHPALLCTGFSRCLLGAGDKMAQETSGFPVLPEDRWVEACVHACGLRRVCVWGVCAYACAVWSHCIRLCTWICSVCSHALFSGSLSVCAGPGKELAPTQDLSQESHGPGTLLLCGHPHPTLRTVFLWPLGPVATSAPTHLLPREPTCILFSA